MQSRFELFTLLISRLSKEIKKIKTKETEEYCLSSPHVIIIYFLHKYNGMTLKELCDACLEDKASVSRSLDALRKKGLINSQNNNHYKNKLSLNEQGCLVATKLCEKIDIFVEIASSGIAEEDRKVMYSCLNIIYQNLKNVSDKYED